jgi:hypothetical protein
MGQKMLLMGIIWIDVHPRFTEAFNGSRGLILELWLSDRKSIAENVGVQAANRLAWPICRDAFGVLRCSPPSRYAVVFVVRFEAREHS